MDDIFDKIKQNFEEVKKREEEVYKQEAALKAESEGVRQIKAELDEARREFERKLAALEKEKAAMAKIPVSNEDIVTINVQGEIFCTLRSTLIQFPETRLAYMFNGRWKEKLLQDEKGHIFIDVSPFLFRKLLDYLTNRRLAGSDHIPFPDVDEKQMPQFKLMLKFLEVEASIYTRMSCFSTHFRSPFIKISTDGAVATNTSSGMGYVLSEDIYQNERVHFELEIEKLENPWMFFGVMSEETSSKTSIGDSSINGNPTAYGWADKGGFWKAGTRQEASSCTIPPNVLLEGRRIEMDLDCETDETSLSIKVLPSGHVQNINNMPVGHSWRLHINLVDCNDSVRLIKVERSTIDNAC